MKTPCELLLEKHQAAEPQLDVIRRNALNLAFRRAATASNSRRAKANLVEEFWLEVIWPARRIWLGLGAAWAVILLVSVSISEPAPKVAAASSTVSPEARLVLKQQAQLMTELLTDDETASARTDKPVVPQPRSEWRDGIHRT